MKKCIRRISSLLLSLATAPAFMLPAFADDLDNGAEQAATSQKFYIIGLVLLGIAVVVFLIINRESLTRRSSAPASGPLDEDKVSDAIRLADPDFKRDDFKKFAGEALLAVLSAHTRREPSMLRQYETDALFSIQSRVIRELSEGRRTNHFEEVKLISVELADYDGKGEGERLTVRATVNMLDYTSEDASGTVLEGSKLAKLNRPYKLVFTRPAGTKSDDSTAWKLDEMVKWKKA